MTCVYQVNIDTEQQKVILSGIVDSGTLIKKLIRAGKDAELWSQKTNHNQKQNPNCIKDGKDNKTQKQGQIKVLESLKNNQQEFNFVGEEGDDYNLDEDEEEDYDEDANQIALLEQQQNAEANNAIKGILAANIATTPNNGNINAGKKIVTPNQNIAMKVIDPNTMAALKMNMNSAQLGGGPNVYLAGFQGNGTNNNVAAILSGGNNNSNLMGIRGFQVHPSNVIQGSSAGFTTNGLTTGHLNSSTSSMIMNLQNRHAMQQPQMMYNRSTFVPPATGYYYNYGQVPYTASYVEPSFNSVTTMAKSHMFSDENSTSSCSVM